MACARPSPLIHSPTESIPEAAMTFVFPAPEAPAIPVAGSSALFPVRRVYCVGRNYAAHAREMGGDPDREPPFFFMKPPNALQAVPADAPREPRLIRTMTEPTPFRESSSCPLIPRRVGTSAVEEALEPGLSAMRWAFDMTRRVTAGLKAKALRRPMGARQGPRTSPPPSARSTRRARWGIRRRRDSCWTVDGARTGRRATSPT